MGRWYPHHVLSVAMLRRFHPMMNVLEAFFASKASLWKVRHHSFHFALILIPTEICPTFIVMAKAFVYLHIQRFLPHNYFYHLTHSQSFVHGVLSFIYKDTYIKLCPNYLPIGTLSQPGEWVLWRHGSHHIKLWILISKYIADIDYMLNELNKQDITWVNLILPPQKKNKN